MRLSRQFLISFTSSVALLVWLFLVPHAFAYDGSSFNSVKNKVFQTPYDFLPHYKIQKKAFGRKGKNEKNAVYQAAKRTLSVAEDFLAFPGGQKLFQANGICFAGSWVIDKPSAYTGLFQYLTHSRVIARASVALDGTTQSDKRAFGMALKLFPEENADTKSPTYNVFVMNTMAGVVNKHVLDLPMDNEPARGGLPPFAKLAVAYRILKDFKAADKSLSSTNPQVGFRPVTHLAEYKSIQSAVVSDQGLQKNVVEPARVVVSPRWLRLTPEAGAPRIDQDDFRDELDLENYPNQTLSWSIDVANATDQDAGTKNKKSKAQWETIGKLTFNESVTSAVCDQQLHFAHPKLP